MTNTEEGVCRNCDGEGVVLYACESDECPANCTGHENPCVFCNGKGVQG